MTQRPEHDLPGPDEDAETGPDLDLPSAAGGPEPDDVQDADRDPRGSDSAGS